MTDTQPIYLGENKQESAAKRREATRTADVAHNLLCGMVQSGSSLSDEEQNERAFKMASLFVASEKAIKDSVEAEISGEA